MSEEQTESNSSGYYFDSAVPSTLVFSGPMGILHPSLHPLHPHRQVDPGRGLCKLWLVMDYLLCSASVFSIVLISYDRFLSVTRAVSYRARQSMTHQAIIKMIAVWVLAFVLYGPAIIFWELAVGRSRVPKDECFAEFITLGTSC
ncbi:hypothetical protein INR49_010710 [Caranx melampygus]|nr:hypothetical protein INR49_010710 [Caranx melampygus]